MPKLFYKDANAVILVYDITRKDTYEEIKDYWLEQIKENTPPETILVFAANKSELLIILLLMRKKQGDLRKI